MAGEPGGKEVPWAEQAIRGTISLDVHARMPSGPDQHHDRIADQTMYAAKRGASTAYDPREIVNTFLGGRRCLCRRGPRTASPDTVVVHGCC